LKDKNNPFVIITEYNTKTQGFLVRSVERIVNMNWEEIHPPPKGTGRDHYLTAVTRVDNQLVEIIDVEKGAGGSGADAGSDFRRRGGRRNPAQGVVVAGADGR
jgi:chemotaxis signal transduction protein